MKRRADGVTRHCCGDDPIDPALGYRYSSNQDPGREQATRRPMLAVRNRPASSPDSVTGVAPTPHAGSCAVQQEPPGAYRCKQGEEHSALKAHAKEESHAASVDRQAGTRGVNTRDGWL